MSGVKELMVEFEPQELIFKVWNVYIIIYDLLNDQIHNGQSRAKMCIRNVGQPGLNYKLVCTSINR